MVGEGQSNRDIACKMCVSEKTVKNCLTTIYADLGVYTRIQAALRALDMGVVPGFSLVRTREWPWQRNEEECG